VPVADTEFIFALSTDDPKHQAVAGLVKRLKGLQVPDTAALELQAVLTSRGRRVTEVRNDMLALRRIMADYRVKKVQTLSTLALQCELEENYRLSYFGSLLAASALVVDGKIVSDDKAFGSIPNLGRIPISE